MEAIAPGIWRIRMGKPERFTPVSMREHRPRLSALEKLPKPCGQPFHESALTFKVTDRGCVVELPLDKDERIFGFGLQLKSINHTAKKKQIRVNADPRADTGDSHAPVPFYVTTSGYGVFVDTARYVSFYCGTHRRRGESRAGNAGDGSVNEANASLNYTAHDPADGRAMVIDIPAAKGVDIYVFAGPEMRNAAQRYNLFSGGGCLPPYWGLGIWYRKKFDADMDEALRTAREMRADGLPCDVLGLEPKWQTHAYSCSYQWNTEMFPDPGRFVKLCGEMGYKINLWEHVFVHPSSPIHDELIKYSGSFEVWEGLVPDLAVGEARRIFAEYHRRELVSGGIAGFKLDECDGSDFTGGWSFPNCAEFPSGLDGEEMHNMLGLLYQNTIWSIYRADNTRTYGQVRSSGALASPLPFVLYSDLYDHRDFIRGVVNMGFSGLLWSPEVRQCDSVEDLVRRVQTVVFSPQAIVNAWMIPNPPWYEYEYEKNLRGGIMANHEEVTALCRGIFELRMSFLPYLYSAFARYYYEGAPPFRALVMDYPGDEKTYDMDDEYMMGESVLVAPMVAGQSNRKVYLPEGTWYCFWTNTKYTGGMEHEIEVPIERIPVFVKEGAMLPLAKPVQYVAPDTCFDITVRCYGEGCSGFTLFEDDGETFDYEKGVYNQVRLSTGPDGKNEIRRSGKYPGVRYKIVDWMRVK